MIVLIGGEKGGTGKTTIATNLAVWLALGGRDVLLVDADKQQSARKWADRRSRYEMGKAEVTCVTRHGNIASTVTNLASRCDDIVIDCGGQDSKELRSAMTVADSIFTPVQASMMDLETVEHVVELVKNAQVTNTTLSSQIFVSAAPTNQRGEEKAALEALGQMLPEGIGLLKTVVHDRRAFRDASKHGLGVLEQSKCKAGEEILALGSEIINLASREMAAE